eukprot:gb/GECH01006720.1/.p1 GENE.gb/GECH01006720.1/~~gb/GECH01006720.1/.p1  ORF type:complete len:667 (+),score=120.24 gb/GECH01006720.1/:1-2001(+)
MQHQKFSFGWYLQVERERNINTSEYEMEDYLESDDEEESFNSPENNNHDKDDSNLSHESNNSIEERLTYCICSRPDYGGFMVQCDICDEWFHGPCVDIIEADLMPSSYFVCCCCSETKQSKVFDSYQEYLVEAQYIAYIQEYKSNFLPPLYCSCMGIDDGQPMICCEWCGEWFHQRCCTNDIRTLEEIDYNNLTLICNECNEDGEHALVSEKVAAAIKQKKRQSSKNPRNPNRTLNYRLQICKSNTPRHLFHLGINRNINGNQNDPIQIHYPYSKIHGVNIIYPNFSSFLKLQPRCRQLMLPQEQQEPLNAWSVCCFEEDQRLFLGTNIGFGIVLKLPDQDQLSHSDSLYSNLMQTDILVSNGKTTTHSESKTKQFSFQTLGRHQWNTLENVANLENQHMENGAWRLVRIPYSSKHVVCGYLLHGAITIQDVVRGERISVTEKAHGAGITDFTFPSNYPNLMITSSFDKRIAFWDYRSDLNSQRIAQSSGPNRHSAAVNGVIMLDDNILISGSADETLKTWDLRSMSNGRLNCVSTVNVGQKVSSISCSPVGSHLALNTDRSQILVVDGNALLYSQTNSNLHALARFSGHKNGLWELGRALFSLDGQLIFTGSEDGSVCLWHVGSGSRYQYYQHQTAVWDLCMTNDFDILSVADGGYCSLVSPYIE